MGPKTAPAGRLRRGFNRRFYWQVALTVSSLQKLPTGQGALAQQTQVDYVHPAARNRASA